MPRRTSSPPAPAAPAAAPAAPAPAAGTPLPDEPTADELGRAAADDAALRVLSRPDGYYWLSIDGRQEVGPFDTVAEALADMDSGDASGWVPGETLAEAESELGVSDWIDPDSGQLAEGQSKPHLSE
ncbi:MAG TPA: hypothetical protein P5163_03540 [Rubrivivax sp.]|nr:hypothetical protein [Rubrivivax sp.]HRY87863.1 hypothetical protein [Rubrivivax sp.]HRZ59640.1 hypothetical protein [Rubrivivax sp.]